MSVAGKGQQRVNVKEQLHPTICKLAETIEEVITAKLKLEPFEDERAKEMMYVEGETYVDGRCALPLLPEAHKGCEG